MLAILMDLCFKIQDTRAIIDCDSFMRYNPDCHVHLDPLSGPTTTQHLDAMSAIPGIDSDDIDQMIYTPPAVQAMQNMARHTRRRFASSRKNVNGKTRSSIPEKFK